MATINKPSAEAVNSEILTKKEAAELLHCTVDYIEEQVRAGRLRAMRPTHKIVRFYRRDIDAFLEGGCK
jgi:excisionase family DNA binding protein